MLQVANQMIPYDKAVVEGKTIVTEVYMRQWRLGELANLVEPKYGGRTLMMFAEEIGVNPNTLAGARSVVRAWPENFRRLKISFGVAQALIRHPDRQQIVLDNPRLTVLEARNRVRKYFAEHDNEDENEEGEIADKSTNEDQWQMSLSNIANEAITLTEYWDSIFDDWRDFPVTPSMISLARKAAAAWSELAASMSIKKGEKDG